MSKKSRFVSQYKKLLGRRFNSVLASFPDAVNRLQVLHPRFNQQACGNRPGAPQTSLAVDEYVLSSSQLIY